MIIYIGFKERNNPIAQVEIGTKDVWHSIDLREFVVLVSQVANTKEVGRDFHELSQIRTWYHEWWGDWRPFADTRKEVEAKMQMLANKYGLVIYTN